MSQEFWDAQAESCDESPDHGLADTRTRAAWRELLLGVLPRAPARGVDLGCGTRTVARLLTDSLLHRDPFGLGSLSKTQGHGHR
jgi:trans-aconitate methyltransferase